MGTKIGLVYYDHEVTLKRRHKKGIVAEWKDQRAHGVQVLESSGICRDRTVKNVPVRSVDVAINVALASLQVMDEEHVKVCTKCRSKMIYRKSKYKRWSSAIPQRRTHLYTLGLYSW